MTLYVKSSLPVLKAVFSPTDCTQGRGASVHTEVPKLFTPANLFYGTVIKAIGFWMRDGGNNRFTRFSFCVYAPFDAILPERYEQWMIVCGAADVTNPAVKEWVDKIGKIQHILSDPPLGNWDGPAHLEKATASPGFAMSGLESHYWNSDPCGQICGQKWWTRHLFTGEEVELSIGSVQTPWRDNYPVNGYNNGTYIQSIDIGWDAAGGNENGVKIIQSVSYLSGLSPLLKNPPEKYRCCATDYRWNPYPNNSFEKVRCLYNQWQMGKDKWATECDLALDDFCRFNMQQEVCLERCKDRGKNCDSLLKYWCTEVKKVTPVEVYENQDLGAICGCFLPDKVYANFFADLNRAGIGKIEAQPQFKECYFGPCARNKELVYALKNQPPNCPSIMACLQEITINNQGEIKGPITVVNDNKCGFTDGKRPQPSPTEETGTNPVIEPDDGSGLNKTKLGVGIGVGLLALLLLIYFVRQLLKK